VGLREPARSLPKQGSVQRRRPGPVSSLSALRNLPFDKALSWTRTPTRLFSKRSPLSNAPNFFRLIQWPVCRPAHDTPRAAVMATSAGMSMRSFPRQRRHARPRIGAGGGSPAVRKSANILLAYGALIATCARSHIPDMVSRANYATNPTIAMESQCPSVFHANKRVVRRRSRGSTKTTTFSKLLLLIDGDDAPCSKRRDVGFGSALGTDGVTA
jgi:hypothetical protein